MIFGHANYIVVYNVLICDGEERERKKNVEQNEFDCQRCRHTSDLMIRDAKKENKPHLSLTLTHNI